MSKYNKLISNSLLFAISNFGSKLLSFILVPIYTYILTTEELGTADLIYATCTILLYIFSVSIGEATMRFTMSVEYKRKAVLSNSLFVAFISGIILLFFMPVMAVRESFQKYIVVMYIIVIIQNIYNILTQYARGTDQVRIFAEAGIIQTSGVLMGNVLLLMYFHLGIIGYLYSYVIGFGIAVIYTIFRIKIWNAFSIFSYDYHLIKEMVCYSYPMIFTGLSWWILNASDKYVISYCLGAAANGIYTVSHKIPSVIAMISSFFNSAWQLSAIDEQQKENDKHFYNNVFNIYSTIIIISSALLIFIIKYLLPFFISKSYWEAVKYVPLLIYSCIFQVFANFFGGFNIAFKKTKSLIWNSLAAAGVNLGLNIVLTPWIGMYGTALATVIGCVIMWLFRVMDARKNMDLTFDLKKIMIGLILVAFQIFLFGIGRLWSEVLQILIILLLIVLYREIIFKLIKKIEKLQNWRN